MVTGEGAKRPGASGFEGRWQRRFTRRGNLATHRRRCAQGWVCQPSGMADEWWLVISHWSACQAYEKL